jgi:hypothetical protein
MVEDDGHSFRYRDGDWLGIGFRWSDTARRLSLSLIPGSNMRPPLPRQIEVRVAGSKRVQPIGFAGRSLTVRL